MPVRAWFRQSRIGRWIAGAVGAAALLIGGALVTRAVWRPTPPDAASAPAAQVLAFIASDAFERMSSADRERLLGETASRYMRLSIQERQAFDRLWRDAALPQSMRRRIDARMEYALACRMADEFGAMPLEQRGPFLDRMLVLIRAMDGGGDFLQWLDGNPARSILRDPGSIQRDLNGFQRNLILGTSAQQRASLTRLGGALLERSRTRTR